MNIPCVLDNDAIHLSVSYVSWFPTWNRDAEGGMYVHIYHHAELRPPILENENAGRSEQNLPASLWKGLSVCAYNWRNTIIA